MNVLDFDKNKLHVFPYRKSYGVKYDGNFLKIKTVCNIPFGIESYNDNKIINLEYNSKINDQYNQKTMIECIDNIVKEKLEKMFSDKKYFINSTKMRYDNVHHHRCYVKNNIGNDIGNNIDKEKMYECEIVLNKIWIYKDTYGLMWVIDNVKQL